MIHCGVFTVYEQREGREGRLQEDHAAPVPYEPLQSTIVKFV